MDKHDTSASPREHRAWLVGAMARSVVIPISSLVNNPRHRDPLVHQSTHSMLDLSRTHVSAPILEMLATLVEKPAETLQAQEIVVETYLRDPAFVWAAIRVSYAAVVDSGLSSVITSNSFVAVDLVREVTCDAGTITHSRAALHVRNPLADTYFASSNGLAEFIIVTQDGDRDRDEVDRDAAACLGQAESMLLRNMPTVVLLIETIDHSSSKDLEHLLERVDNFQETLQGALK